jgi:7-cyano-7-deazaguanine synthase
MKGKVPVMVLGSGGIDSTALIQRYASAREKTKVVHFQYGQANGKSELKAVRAICKHYGLRPHVVNLGFRMVLRGYELLGRNALFVLIASAIENPPNRISIGIHAGPEMYDTTRLFVADCQRLLDGYFNGTVVLEAPFADYEKGDIISYCKKAKVPLKLTYSCQRKNFSPCGSCPSCLDRQTYLGTI